ncbi:Mitochondrial import receptor subunit TOM70 [Habropoda laboriosa]|uniref:Mitochondrial import receptor subunit TOM70 n=1 Tax=Habropoda laboriosa TaxID=597456 RepID=A0A0L7R660_9HYME|nr:PREDICTED: mitochondrial import receptor subunit TOM70 [Habropoda laboriosa]KOC66261.1 Mitochondrial import receptor subunit TOM70 [Habropoda laboriosa]
MTRACGASNVTGPLPKWQLALAVATPVALGFGYMYYKNNRKPSSKPSRGKPKNSSKENGAPTSDKQISIDVDCPPTKIISEPETSLEKAQRYKNEGNDHFKMGKFDEAIAQYNIAIEVCPKENEEALATFYQNRAAAYEQLKKYSAVKADCTKAIELKPRYAKALHRRARVFELCNKLEAALEDLTTARISKSFSDESTITMSDRILNQLSRQNAIEYLANKTLIMPSQFFIKTYIAGFPSDPVFSMLKETDYSNISPGFAKVLQCVKEERYDDVIPLCTEEINSSEPDTLPDKMKVLLLRATFYLLLGHGAAIEDLGTIIDSDTASKSIKANALIKRASLFMQSENPDKSFCDFETAVELDPDCCDIYQCRGQVNLLMDKVNEAREDFKKAFELNPFFKVAYVQKCYADYRYGLAKGDEELITEGIKNCKKAFKKFPDCPECYILYAQILSEMRNYEKADIYFAKACEKDPHNATVYVHRGLLQLQGYGDVEKAIEYINKALEIDDKCESAYETLGLIEVQRGNFTEAIKLFDKALPLGRTVVELTHIFSLQNAVKIQYTVRDRLDSEQL